MPIHYISRRVRIHAAPLISRAEFYECLFAFSTSFCILLPFISLSVSSSTLGGIERYLLLLLLLLLLFLPIVRASKLNSLWAPCPIPRATCRSRCHHRLSRWNDFLRIMNTNVFVVSTPSLSHSLLNFSFHPLYPVELTLFTFIIYPCPPTTSLLIICKRFGFLSMITLGTHVMKITRGKGVWKCESSKRIYVLSEIYSCRLPHGSSCYSIWFRIQKTRTRGLRKKKGKGKKKKKKKKKDKKKKEKENTTLERDTRSRDVHVWHVNTQ